MRVRIRNGSNFSFNEIVESDKVQEQAAQNDVINVPENVTEQQEDTKNNILNFEMPNLDAYKTDMPKAGNVINEEVQTESPVKNISEMPKADETQEVSNHAQIKNTLDALMKRGRSLTAEEIRESLAALSLTGRQVKTEEVEEKKEEKAEDIKQDADIEKQEVTDKTFETTTLSDTE